MSTPVYSVAGEVRSRGLELDASGQLSERWSLIGSYAYTDAEVTKDPALQGKRLQNVAKHTGSLSAVYDVGSLIGGDQSARRCWRALRRPARRRCE